MSSPDDGFPMSFTHEPLEQDKKFASSASLILKKHATILLELIGVNNTSSDEMPTNLYLNFVIRIYHILTHTVVVAQ